MKKLVVIRKAYTAWNAAFVTLHGEHLFTINFIYVYDLTGNTGAFDYDFFIFSYHFHSPYIP